MRSRVARGSLTPRAHHSAPTRIRWARRHPGVRYRHGTVSLSSGTLTIIAAIEDPTLIAKTLTHLGLSARATTPIAGAALRSNPYSLTLDRFPLPSGSAP
jgi:hypothetical protein